MSRERYAVTLLVRSPDLRRLAQVWGALHEHVTGRLVELRRWGLTEQDDELVADAELLVWARGERAARAMAERVLARVLAAAGSPPATHTADVVLAPGEDPADELGPDGPQDFEPTQVRVPWDRCEPSADGRTLVVEWSSAGQPLDRVDADEDDRHVAVTLWEHRPPRFDLDGTPIAMALPLVVRRTEVTLTAPLAGRVLVDGATGPRLDA